MCSTQALSSKALSSGIPSFWQKECARQSATAWRREHARRSLCQALTLLAVTAFAPQPTAHWATAATHQRVFPLAHTDLKKRAHECTHAPPQRAVVMRVQQAPPALPLPRPFVPPAAGAPAAAAALRPPAQPGLPAGPAHMHTHCAQMNTSTCIHECVHTGTHEYMHTCVCT